MAIIELYLTVERTNELRKLFSRHPVADIFDFVEDTGIPLQVIQDYLNCNLKNCEYIKPEHIKAIAAYLSMSGEELFQKLSKCNNDDIVIGIVGHRDIPHDYISKLEEITYTLYMKIKKRFPLSQITVISSLAEGTDQLSARAALRAGFRLIVSLPMSAEEYRDDFNEETALEFDRLCSCADDVVVPIDMPFLSLFATPEEGWREVGNYIMKHANVFVALWDGVKKEQADGAGTYETVKFALFDESIKKVWQIVTPRENSLPDNVFSVVPLKE